MGFLKVFVWSALCIGLGIFLGTHSFDGHTAVEHAERSLNGKVKAPSLSEVKDDVAEAIDSAKKKLAAKDGPTEKHTLEEKDAVNKLIARRKP
jgi:hypothetical protein